MHIIGLTGNSGCGKSYIASMLAEKKCYIINADKVGHQVLKKNILAYNEVVSIFGNEILDSNNNIDRKVLGSIVFSNKEKLETLNSIVHKHIVKLIRNKIDEVKFMYNIYKCIVIDAALLIETNLHNMCNKVIVVYADEEIRINRIIKRDNLSKQEALNRIKSQTHFENLKKYADFVIVNNDNGNNIQLTKSINDILNTIY